MHIFYFFYFFSIFLLFIFLGLGPAQPTWVGLDPASPARSLAQASDPAGPQHAWTSFMRAWHCAKVINYLRTVLNALKFRNKNEEEEKAYLAAGCFAGVLACWAKISGGVRW